MGKALEHSSDGGWLRGVQIPEQRWNEVCRRCLPSHTIAHRKILSEQQAVRSWMT